MKYWIILALAASAFGGALAPNVANYAYPPGGTSPAQVISVACASGSGFNCDSSGTGKLLRQNSPTVTGLLTVNRGGDGEEAVFGNTRKWYLTELGGFNWIGNAAGGLGYGIATDATHLYLTYAGTVGMTMSSQGVSSFVSVGNDRTLSWRSGSVMGYLNSDNDGVGIFDSSAVLDGFYFYKTVHEFWGFAGGTKILTVATGGVTISTNAGSGNAYACFDSNGKLFRSGTPCL